MSLLPKKRGVVISTDVDPKTNVMEIVAEIPMKEVVGAFSTEIRNVSQGRATYSSEFLKWQVI